MCCVGAVHLYVMMEFYFLLQNAKEDIGVYLEIGLGHTVRDVFLQPLKSRVGHTQDSASTGHASTSGPESRNAATQRQIKNTIVAEMKISCAPQAHASNQPSNRNCKG